MYSVKLPLGRMQKEEEDKTSEELIKLDQKLAILINNSDESYILVDTNFKIIAFNRHFKSQYLKYFGQEVNKGDSIFKLIKEERIQKLREVYERVFAGKTETTELETNLPNGKKLVISNTFKPAFDEDGKIIGAFVSSLDISELREVERQKKEAEIRLEFEHNNLKALINNTKSLIWSIDLNYRLISFNNSFQKYYHEQTGNKPLKGDSYLNFTQFYDQTERMKLYVNRVKQGESFTITEHIYDPTETWKEISFNPINDEDGKIIGIACISTDVTERKMFERQLIKNQSRLKQAQSIAHLGNWELKFQSNSAIWSDEAYRIYGITPSNFDHTFESWLSFIHPEDLPKVNAVIKKGYDTLEDYSIYHRIIRPDGEIRHLYSETHFEFDLNGKPIGVYGIAHDITERKSNELALQELLRKSNEHNKWLDNFTHIVSHNIKSHNNNIIGLIDLLESSNDKKETDSLIKLLRLSGEKLNETVNNLSEYISFQNDAERHFKKINLHSEFEKTCISLSHMISETGAKIINEIDPELEVTMIPSFIESILLNLLSNALKYRSKSEPLVVKIKAERKNGKLNIQIEDNGIGIDLDIHGENIFGMYQTFNGNKDALGFGLFITKNQVEAMNGKIEVKSIPGKGTTFNLYFNEKA